MEQTCVKPKKQSKKKGKIIVVDDTEDEKPKPKKETKNKGKVVVVDDEKKPKKETKNKKVEDINISYIKPVIKWAGGKTQIIDSVIEKFPKNVVNYHEPFLGGGSVLLAFLQNVQNNKIKLNGNVYASDINETLINMYINIQKRPKKLISDIREIIDVYNSIDGDIVNRKPKTLDEGMTSQESYYYWVRTQFNSLRQTQKNKVKGTAYFIFLNKTCFRGLHREGPNGFNVPFGHYTNPEIINDVHINAVSKLIKNVIFTCQGFEESFLTIKKGDFVYVDPPYAPVNDKSFVNYTADGFGLDKHQLLFSECKKHNFLMSNADVSLVNDSFNDQTKYQINVISCKRSINSKKPSSKINEVLINSI